MGDWKVSRGFEVCLDTKLFLKKRFITKSEKIIDQKSCLDPWFGLHKGEVAFGPDQAFYAPILSFLLRLGQFFDMVGEMCAILRF